jgi:hypothetical protein
LQHKISSLVYPRHKSPEEWRTCLEFHIISHEQVVFLPLDMYKWKMDSLKTG